MKQSQAIFGMLAMLPTLANAAPLAAIAPEKSIALAQAIEAGQAAIAACATKKAPITVEIMDLNGLAKVVLSADGAQTNSMEYARRKAYTALQKGMSTRAYGASLGTLPPNPYPLEGDANLIEWPGALPIMRNGVVIGAIAVAGPTGGDDDEACARAGLAYIH